VETIPLDHSARAAVTLLYIKGLSEIVMAVALMATTNVLTSVKDVLAIDLR
jgi:hypothetical protein